jgi:3-hydroxyisobutyrate dehydrogenase-like beta-hydroxyacid dehydrogenase
METVGVVGLGRIGLRIADNLIKSGYRVVGYRRNAMTEFMDLGGKPADSPADVGAAADIVFSCLPSAQALDEVFQGPHGLVRSARPGQILVELGSYPLPVKERQIAPLAARGAVFIDGEVAGTPGMVRERKGVVFLAGDRDACVAAERVVAGFADACFYFGAFGAATKVKLVNNLLVAVHIAATAEAMMLGLQAGVDVDMMIKAIAGGSGGSTQFGIRAPWMVERRFLPAQGTAVALWHYLEEIDAFAAGASLATPMRDRAAELFKRCIDMGLGEHDVAVMVDVLSACPRTSR